MILKVLLAANLTPADHVQFPIACRSGGEGAWLRGTWKTNCLILFVVVRKVFRSGDLDSVLGDI